MSPLTHIHNVMWCMRAGLFGGRSDPLSKLMHAPDARTFEASVAESRTNKVQPGGVSLRYLFKLDDALMSMTQGVSK
jgi:hypothetical protein